MKSSRWLDCRSRFKLLFLFAFIFINVVSAFAGPSVTTYQAKIIKPDGLPLEASSVNFRFTILDPTGGCILYAENYTAVNMTSTSGLISFSLGSGVKSFPASATTFEQVFSNITPTLSCDAGGLPSYSPSANDSRKIVMQFHDGSGWQTLPAMNINAVPYAMFANDSQKLGGVSATSFVQTSMIPSCAASEAVRYNGTSFSCIAVGGAGGGGSVTSGSVITALGYTPADGASVTTLSSNLSSTNSTVSAVSSSVNTLSGSFSTLASGLFTVSSTVTGLSTSVTSLITTASNHAASLTALSNDLASVSSTMTSLSASFATITSSQWLTSGTAISYNSGNVGIGVSTPANLFQVNWSPAANWEIQQDIDKFGNGISLKSAYSVASPAGEARLNFYKSRGTLAAPAGVLAGDFIGTIGFRGTNASGTSLSAAAIRAIAAQDFINTAAGSHLIFQTTPSGTATATEKLRIDPQGFVGIGTTAPVTRLDVSGGVRIGIESATCSSGYAGTLRYNSGVVEYCNGTSWVAFGVSGAGIMALNGLTSGSQTFATGSAGLTANVSSTGTVHTFNIPLAATNGVTGGLVSNADYQYFTNSIASTVTSLTAVANNQASNAVSFAALASQQSTNAASFATIAAQQATNLASFATVALQQATNAASFAAVASSLNTTNANVAAVSSAVSALTSSQWITSATNVGYTTGNVGINTTSPRQNLDIAPAAGNAIVRATSTNAAAALQLYRNAGGGNYYGPVLWSNGTNLNFGHDTSENAGPTLMTLTTGGALGIGTLSPSDILHVVKSTDSRVLVDSVTGSSGLELRTGSVSSAGGGYIDFASSATSHTSPDYDFRLITNTSGLNVMTPGSNARLTVNANGNIGIGATTANRKLHVQYNESGADDGVMIENQGNAGANLSLKSSGAGGREFMWISTGSANSIGAGALGLYDNAAPGYRMVVGSNGNVGIGNNAPSAKLHLGAGTTSFAPLKLTSGALLTSAASGAIEYDGFNYYVTDGTNTRRAIATVANPGTYDNASNISSTGNITMTPTGSVVVSSTTASVNAQTGALVVKGGLGVATDINASGTLNVTGAATFGSNVFGNGNFSTGGGNRGYWMDVPGNFNYGIWRDPSDNVHIRSGGTTNRLTIASSTGWVGIGTNPGSPLHVMGQQAIENNTNSAGGASISFWKNRNYAATQNNDEHGYISFFGHDGSTTLRSAYVLATGDGPPTAGSVPGNLRFFTTNGGSNDSTEKLRITSGGAVGIGTIAPATQLHISGNRTAMITQTQTAAMPDISSYDVGGINYIDNYLRDSITSNPAAYMKIRSVNTNGSFPTAIRGTQIELGTANGNNGQGTQASTRLTIDPDGKVGIGTSSPVERLDVNGNVRASSYTFPAPTGDPAPTITTRTVPAGQGDASEKTELILFHSNDFNNGSGVDQITLRAPALSFQTYASATVATIDDAGGYNERMYINPAGNVGIGTTTPDQKLSVVGDISVTGQLTSKDFFEKTVNIADGWAIGDYVEIVQGWPAAAGGSSNWEVHVGGTRGSWTEGTTYLITGTHAVGNAWREVPHSSESGYVGNSKCFTVDINGNGNSPQFRIRAVKASASCGTAGPVLPLNFRIRSLGNNAGWTSLSATGTGATVVGMQPMGLSWSLYTGNPQGNGNLAIHANTAGNVGVGTAAPTEKLEVAGNIKVSGEVYKTTSWGFKKGPAAYVSDYINSWTSGYHVGTSLDCTSSANGCSILKSGTYEIRCVQRATSTSSTFIGIALNGDRVTLEGYANGVWSHDHSISPGGFTESNYMGTLTAGQFISCGPPAANSTTVVYAPSAYNGTLTIKRID